jgi:glycosyltransferase involved in cell wall biosynthesis
MKKQKLLCILHYTPPAHGASKVGDFIKSSQKLKDEFDCRFIKIKSSDTIGDIGKVNFKKIYFVMELFFKILFTVLIFRPNKIYFTASIKGVAFFRDVLLSTIWKFYKLFVPCEVFYHYHTKGIKEFVKNPRNLKLTKYFLKDINLILLSPILKADIEDIKTYKKVLFLPNGVEDTFKTDSFEKYISNKSFDGKIDILYLAHMMRDKGCFEAIKLVNQYKNQNIHFHFAGSWQNQEDEKEFLNYIKKYQLESYVTLHGFVSGDKKKELFKSSHLLLYPSKNDAFPLTLLESFSYGLPVLSTNEGSIPYIIDNKSGIVVNDLDKLDLAFEEMLEKYINIETARYCRKRYLENFSLEQFEENLLEVLK